jgi:CxxC motif-containing protein (DUF1111 family)
MRRTILDRQRRWFTAVLIGLLVGSIAWVWSPGIPILWGPTASAEEIAAGRELFEHQWEPNDPLSHGDGLGPVYNAKACVACHFQGGVGGGGLAAHNALNYEVLPRPEDPTLVVGTVHNFSVSPAHRESPTALRRAYPVLRGIEISPGSTADCDGPRLPRRTPDFDPVRTESVQTTALYGAGWIDLIAEKAILKNARSRSFDGVMAELVSDFSQLPVGRVRTLPDGRIGKFGWRGQFATLEEFVATACANEIGLGTPSVPQAKPLGARFTPDVQPDLDRGQFRSLVAFVKTLPRPVETTPADPVEQASAERGKELFRAVGCAVCHIPNLGGVRGIYSDLLLYTLEDPAPPGGGGSYGGSENPRGPPRPDDLPRPEEWKTPPLWGVADSAPYFHDGASPTLQSAIVRHAGDARPVTARFKALSPDDQAAVLAFLGTLKAPPDAPAVRDPSVTRLVRK